MIFQIIAHYFIKLVRPKKSMASFFNSASSFFSSKFAYSALLCRYKPLVSWRKDIISFEISVLWPYVSSSSSSFSIISEFSKRNSHCYSIRICIRIISTTESLIFSKDTPPNVNLIKSPLATNPLIYLIIWSDFFTVRSSNCLYLSFFYQNFLASLYLFL